VLAAASAVVTPGTPVSGTGGTVGNGAVGTWTADAGAPAGTWYLKITKTTTNLGNFEVVRPDGTIDGVGTVGTAYNGQINGTLADGSERLAVRRLYPDRRQLRFGSEVHQVCRLGDRWVADADMILAQDADASGGDVEAMAYETGKFNWSPR
jgi:hypothetical protein